MRAVHSAGAGASITLVIPSRLCHDSCSGPNCCQRSATHAIPCATFAKHYTRIFGVAACLLTCAFVCWLVGRWFCCLCSFSARLVTPHPVWVVLLVTLVSLYGAAFAWARSQATAMSFERHRQGAVLVAGDLLREDFVLANAGQSAHLVGGICRCVRSAQLLTGKRRRMPDWRHLSLVERS